MVIMTDIRYGFTPEEFDDYKPLKRDEGIGV